MPLHPANPETIAACAARLAEGALVAFPTETVYGLGGDATDATAVAAIYAAKERPRFNPLIIHTATPEAARKLGVFDDDAARLAAHFWPGALSLVVPRAPDCPVAELAVAGLPTLALRCPAHPVAAALLAAFGKPVAAPSANPSGRISPTRARHVAAHLPDIDILDGGDANIGLESTIIGCLGDTPALLRSGGIARADIEACLGKPLADHNADTPNAPGQLARHYAPLSLIHI